jgi:opacity protein-like surface antigen
MRIIFNAFAFALLFGAAVSPAAANSYYGAIDVGRSTVKDNCAGLSVGISGCKDTASMYRIASGYQFGPWHPHLRGFEREPMWAMEVSYGDYGKASGGTGLGVSSNDWRIRGLQLSGVGIFPFGNGFSLLLKFGVARTNAKVSGIVLGSGINLSATRNNRAYGIGAQYDFTENISARAQYEDLGTAGDSNMGTNKIVLRSIGIVFKF